MHRTTNFYKWRQRFLRRNYWVNNINGKIGYPNHVIREAWDRYNGREPDWFSLFFFDQVSGKEFRE